MRALYDFVRRWQIFGGAFSRQLKKVLDTILAARTLLTNRRNAAAVLTSTNEKAVCESSFLIKGS